MLRELVKLIREASHDYAKSEQGCDTRGLREAKHVAKALIADCRACGHHPHVGHGCGYPITETIRDDVGIFCKPSGITRTVLVDMCNCGLEQTS